MIPRHLAEVNVRTKKIKRGQIFLEKHSEL